MALEHLLIFGFAEAAVTALVVGYLQKADLPLLSAARGESQDPCGIQGLESKEGATA
jgi:hypothetical protein